MDHQAVNNYSCKRCEGDLFLIHLKYHISNQELERIWARLPDTYRKNEEIIELLPCYEHYNLPSSRTHIDGPPPSKKNCGGCKQNVRTK